MLVLACLLAVAAAASGAPATFDQQQDGELNVRADVQNVILLVALPQKMHFLDGLFKSAKNRDLELRRADTVMEAFVEPNTPYHVEIGSDRAADGDREGDGRTAEVVIAGRRRLENEVQAEPEPEHEHERERDEIKLLGDAIENCGPERERDPATLTCRFRSQPDDSPVPLESPQPQLDSDIKKLATKATPEVVPAAS